MYLYLMFWAIKLLIYLLLMRAREREREIEQDGKRERETERDRERRDTETERETERDRERERLNQSWRSHIVSVSAESRRGEMQARTHTHLINTHMERESETGFQHYSWCGVAQSGDRRAAMHSWSRSEVDTSNRLRLHSQDKAANRHEPLERSPAPPTGEPTFI